MLAESASALNSPIVAALQRASAATGSDFHYLLGTAMRESNLKPGAQSSSSSAAGLFQFVEQTWLGMVKDYGAKYGLGSYANAIGKGADGRFRVDSPADRQAVLALRTDPQISALMAGEYASQCKVQMQSALGRDVSGGELYAAHFLGPEAACKLIQLNGSAPDAAAASAFPAAAGANKNVFYHSDGTPKTVREVHDWALGQPTLAGAPAPAPASVAVTASVPAASNYADMLASMWTQSSTGFFSGGEGAPSPFLLTPGVLDILSSATPKDGDAQ